MVSVLPAAAIGSLNYKPLYCSKKYFQIDASFLSRFAPEDRPQREEK
jgi:hypothetical protein